MARHLLVTGLPGTGKTTLLIRLARLVSDLHPSGFYTQEIQEGRERRGFRLEGLDGSQGTLAHVDLPGHQRVGRYGVDVAGFDRFLDSIALQSSAGPLVVIDEIGKMECLSPRFKSLVRELLDSDKTVVASVAMKGEGLMSEVKERPDCELREVTPANRVRMASDLEHWVRAHVSAQT